MSDVEVAKIIVEADTRQLKQAEKDLQSLANTAKNTGSSVGGMGGKFADATKHTKGISDAVRVAANRAIGMNDSYTGVKACMLDYASAAAKAAGATSTVATATGVAADAATNLTSRFKLTALGALSIAAVLALTTRHLWRFGMQTIASYEALDELSNKTGRSIPEVSALRFAAIGAGVGVDSLADSVVRLEQKMLDASKDRSMAATLDHIGVTSKDGVEAYMQLADAVKNAATQEDALAIATSVFGDRMARQLLPRLREGSEKMREYLAIGNNANSMTEEGQRQAEQYAHNIMLLGLEWQAVKEILGNSVIPKILTLSGYMRDQAANAVAVLQGKWEGMVGFWKSNMGLIAKMMGGGFGFNMDDTVPEASAGGAGGGATADSLAALEEEKKLRESLKGVMDSSHDRRMAQYNKELALVHKMADEQMVYPKARSEMVENLKDKYKDLFPDPEKPKKATKNVSDEERYIAALKKEAETYGMTSEQVSRYEASLLKLSPVQKRQEAALLASLKAKKEEAAAATANNDDFDYFFEQEEKKRLAIEEAIRAGRLYAEGMAFENSLIGMSNDEREVAIQLREMEVAGIDKASDAYKQMADRIRAAQEVGKGSLGGIEASFSDALAVISAKEQSLSARVEAGLISQAEARIELRNAIGAQGDALARDLLPRIEQLMLVTKDEKSLAVLRQMVDEIAKMQAVGKQTTWIEGIKAGLVEYKNTASDIFTSVKDVTVSIFKSMEDAIVEFATTGKTSVSEMADAIIADLVRIAAKKLIVDNVMGMMKLIPGIGGMFADGGAFQNGRVSAFANGGILGPNGGILTQPTIFPMANGAALGLGGEAGDEAVMPVKRLSNGKLGVHADGGKASNVSVVVNNYSGNEVTQKEETDSSGNRRIEVTIGEMVAGEVRRTGSAMNNSFRQAFGAAPMLVGR